MTKASPIVSTAAGSVEGTWESDLAVFRGIPFAAPPVGDLRFQAPERPERWDGIRQTDSFGPPPPQIPLDLSESASEATFERHEPNDWLTVNVWTPSPGAGSLPVLVWIYGGAYRFGSSSESMYDSARLARAGAVVVTANHRIGVEGYADLDGAPANRGLLDQIAMLTWVQEEIAAFGGDPGRVTIFGESAGAGAVSSLLVMPKADGLFARAIAQSVPATFFSPELARDISTELFAPLGLRPTVEEISGVDPAQITDAVIKLDAIMPTIRRWGYVALTPTPFSPIVDGEVLPTDPWTGLRDGASKDIPLIAGHTQDEFRLFLVRAGLAGKIDAKTASHMMGLFGPGRDAEEKIRAAYPAADDEDLMVLTQSDRMFRMPSVQLASAHTAAGGRSYVYELTWDAPGAGGLLGACHSLDIPLTFGTYSGEYAELLIGKSVPPEAEFISEQIRSAWLGFATHGQPGWPEWNEDDKPTRVFDDEQSAGVYTYPEERSLELWRDTPPGVCELQI